MGGDDLDDFVLEPVRSGDEGESGDEDGMIAIHPSRRKAADEDAGTGKKKSKKRKTGGAGGGEKAPQPQGEGGGAQLSKAEKRKKQREQLRNKLRSKDAEEDNLITGPAADQYEVFWKHFMAHKGEALSELELEPIKVDAECFMDPPAQWLHQPREMAQLRPFLKAVIPDWTVAFSKKGSGSGRAGKVPGSPCVVIVTAAAIKAADMFKELKEFNSLCRVGKLFAKHVKQEEQEHFLRNEVTRIVVGTPNRIARLIESGALRMEQVRLVLVDLGRDAKGLNVFQLKPLCADLLALCHAHILPLMHDKKLKMALF